MFAFILSVDSTLISPSVTQSTDTFYGILCSGLTSITKLFFTSSNSSFTECVRRHSSLHHSGSNDYPSCPPGKLISGRCSYKTKGPTLSGSGTFIFSHTDFTICKHSDNGGYGGAIDCTGGDLTIKRCSFVQCSCSNRGGAVSFRSTGTCTQEDNLYRSCWSDYSSGAFDSWDTSKYPHHNQKRCKYIDNHSTYYAHISIEYSSGTIMNSNIYIHGRSDATRRAGTVVNYHSKNSVAYTNCLFSDGKAYNSGGLSFLGSHTANSATLTVKFCFFINNFGTDGTAREIYFDTYTSSNARENLIIHSLSATPGSTLYIQNNPSKGQDWLARDYI